MANGLFGGGTGTSTDPYLVEDAKDLNAVRNKLSAYYKQVANIDMSDWGNWEPIGTMDREFVGLYNGNGHHIKNLTCVHVEEYIGLFGRIRGINANILNLGLIDVNVVGTSYVGGLVGDKVGKITNCYVSGTVRGISKVGLLCGRNYDQPTNNCIVLGIVTGNSEVGGVFGNVDNLAFSNCFVVDVVICRNSNSTSTTFGDIYGSGRASITNCYSLDTLEFRQL